MAVRSSRETVEVVLADMKSALLQGKFYLVRRDKNIGTLSRLGLTLSDVCDTLSELAFANYVKGPETDRDDPASDKLWVFKQRVNEQTVYIKFKVEYQTNGQVKVISFHIDESA